MKTPSLPTQPAPSKTRRRVATIGAVAVLASAGLLLASFSDVFDPRPETASAEGFFSEDIHFELQNRTGQTIMIKTCDFGDDCAANTVLDGQDIDVTGASPVAQVFLPSDPTNGMVVIPTNQDIGAPNFDTTQLLNYKGNETDELARNDNAMDENETIGTYTNNWYYDLMRLNDSSDIGNGVNGSDTYKQMTVRFTVIK